MAFLRVVRPAVIRRAVVATPQRAAFSGSVRVWSGKEDRLHHEGRKEEIEEHKSDSLNKAGKGKGEWKDELASNSESIIKADRGEIDASEDTISQLQKESAEALKKK